MQDRAVCALAQALFMLCVVAVAAEHSAHKRAPVPDAQAQESSKKTAAEIYRDAFRQAKTAAEKTDIAKEMCNAAKGIPDGSAA